MVQVVILHIGVIGIVSLKRCKIISAQTVLPGITILLPLYWDLESLGLIIGGK